MKSFTLRTDTVTHTELQFTLSGTPCRNLTCLICTVIASVFFMVNFYYQLMMSYALYVPTCLRVYVSTCLHVP